MEDIVLFAAPLISNFSVVCQIPAQDIFSTKIALISHYVKVYHK